MGIRRISIGLVLGIVVSLAVAATVSARRESAKSHQSAKLQTVNIAVYPSADYAAMYLGLKLGIFKKHGLNLKITYVYTGAGLFAAITSGQDDLATNSPTAGANAIAQGLPIKMVTATDFQPTRGNTEVLVKSDSPIKSYADLAGKNVATINLQGLFNLGVDYAIQKAGGDPASIHALAMSPADEGNALLAGRIDAAVVQDPFLTEDLAQGGFRSIGNPFSVFPFKVPVGAFWSSTSTIAAKPALLKAFKAAWVDCVAAAKKHPATLRYVMTKYTGISSAIASKITLPEFTSGLTPNSLGPMLVVMKQYGWVNTIPGFNQIYWSGK